MKKKSTLLCTIILFFSTNILSFSEKVIVPIANDGAWSINNKPSSVYYNGKYFFSWISSSGNLELSSYESLSGEVKSVVVAAGYGTEDFSSPSLLIRSSGQLMVFAVRNGTETNIQCYRSNSLDGDISAGFVVSNITGYGISSILPFTMGDNIVLLWRSKNNLGYTFYSGANATGETNALSASGTKRTGFLGDPGFGNNYQLRDEVPTMQACQDSEGNIHLAITQLGTGLKYDLSTIHYVKMVNDNGVLKYYKASGESVNSLSYNTPADIVYATSANSDKAIAYDIAFIEDQPAILYDCFIGNNVNSVDNPGATSNHIYKIAIWDGVRWNSHNIVHAGDGLSITNYKAVGGRTFYGNSYQCGGICFDSDNSSAVYLSAKLNEKAFGLYKYESKDNGFSWTQSAQINSTPLTGKVDIRPFHIKNSSDNKDVDLIWMRGTYNNPSDFSTSIVAMGDNKPIKSISFDVNQVYLTENEETILKFRLSPLFTNNASIVLESDNPSVVSIIDEFTVKALSVGHAVITAKFKSDSSISASCEVYVENQSVFDVFMDRIVNEAMQTKISTVAELEAKVEGCLNALLPDGSFTDIDYSATDRTNWAPLMHLNRMMELSLSYVCDSSKYFSNLEIKTKLNQMLQFWLNTAPRSNNWYQNEIAEPQRMGLSLILMQHKGLGGISSDLFDDAITRMKTFGGNPASQAGANRVDVALHWLYRGCLTSDRALLKTSMDFIYSPIEYTTGSEGIQYDNSYTQHGRQLHIGAYGEVFLDGITKACKYAVGTAYGLPSEKLNILSSLVKNTYMNSFRGNNIFYNVIGRSVTRPGATIKGKSKIFDRMMLIDEENASGYLDANKRLSGEKPSDYNVNPSFSHYYCTDYSVSNRKNYSVDLRMVSSRTVRNEYLADNLEGKKQYFLSDGSTGIYVKGNEYADIFPVWNWAKIPGVTCPEFLTIPQTSSYIKIGQSDFVGGVSDRLNGVSVYKYSDQEFGVNTSANKSWFFFDREIVCVGSDIKSQASFQVNTTLNQCLLDGEVVFSEQGKQASLVNGKSYFNNSLDWVYHGGVAYYFPNQGIVDLSAQPQSGSWFDINGNYSKEQITKNVFALSLNHGINPVSEKYAYVVVPGLANASEAMQYKLSDVEILVNSDSIQAVYKKSQGVFGFVFYKACGINVHGLTVEVDAPCVMLVKDIDKNAAVVHVADPSNGSTPINIGISTPIIQQRRLITYQTVSPFLGSTVQFMVNENSPIYKGRTILLDRKDWIITTNIKGVIDESVGGDNPYFIIDGDTRSSFLFVKPGKIFGGVEAPSDYKPSFIIDMQKENAFSSFIYRHRTFNNNASPLRAKKVSIFGKVNEVDEYCLIQRDVVIPTDIAEVKVLFDNPVFYRFVNFVIEDWDNSSGNTIQLSEFNLGLFGMSEFEDITTDSDELCLDLSKVRVGPNPVRKGQLITVLHSFPSKIKCEVFSINGNLKSKTIGNKIDSSCLEPGVYLLRVSDSSNKIVFKTKVVVVSN